uniref:Si:ch211-130m23.3 n=1 Tax=Astyanax mexicanus TaxID=7994 RepID=A0A8B9KKG9_ASTMX
MYSRSRSARVPSDSQAREKLALYVYEYLLHVGAQKSAQTFLSEIRWEKNITLGEPPGFLHSWWCVFWDLYCAAPERRETCEHSSEAKAFHDYSATAVPSPASGNLPPGEGMPVPPGFFQQFMSPRCPGGPRAALRIPAQAMGPGSQPLLSGMDPMRQPGHPNMNGPMQRMTPPRGMIPIGPQGFAAGMRPPVHTLMGPAMPGMAPGGGRPWPNPPNANSVSVPEYCKPHTHFKSSTASRPSTSASFVMLCLSAPLCLSLSLCIDIILIFISRHVHGSCGGRGRTTGHTGHAKSCRVDQFRRQHVQCDEFSPTKWKQTKCKNFHSAYNAEKRIAYQM